MVPVVQLELVLPEASLPHARPAPANSSMLIDKNQREADAINGFNAKMLKPHSDELCP